MIVRCFGKGGPSLLRFAEVVNGGASIFLSFIIIFIEINYNHGNS